MCAGRRACTLSYSSYMIRLLRYNTSESFCDSSLPEEVTICTSPELLRDPEIEGYTYIEGTFPAEIVAYSTSCGKNEVTIKYDDVHLANYNEETERSDSPLTACDLLGIIRANCLVRYLTAYIDSLVGD